MKSYAVRQVFIAFLGAIVSAYLLYHFVDIRGGFSREPSFCSISKSMDCDQVAKSPYAELFGFPVAGYGLMYYLGYIFLVWLGRREGEGDQSETEARLASVRYFFATLTIPITIFLIVVSKLFIHTYCIMCITLYVVNIVLVLLAWKDPNRPRGGMQSWLSGAGDLVRGLTGGGNSSIRSFPLVGFLLGEVALVLLLPTVFLEGFLRPHAAQARSKELLSQAYDLWHNAPVQPLPSFDTSGAVSPDLVFGNPLAKVTIVEFSDLECPACHRYAPYLEPALERYRGKVRFIYKHFPLDNACNRIISEPKHIYACEAARMAVCAGQQGQEKLWKFIVDTFALRSVDSEALGKVRDELKLNADQFSACIAAEESLQRIKNDIELGIGAGVNSTPTFFVNGKLLMVNPRLFEGVLGMIIDAAEKPNKQP